MFRRAEPLAYDVNAIDQPLSDRQLHNIIEAAVSLSDDPRAIRTLRQFKVNESG